jgi:uncharacterized protein YlxW (UPF0749 family)
MSEGRPGPSVPEGTGDEVVPHPFGPGHGAQDADPEAGEPASDAATPDAAPPDDAPREESTPEEPAPDEPAPDEPAPATGQETPQKATTEPEASPGAPAPAGRPRVRRDPLAAALIAVLTLLLGFAIAVQVKSVGDEQVLAGAREEDLVRILDELSARESRLRDQISDQRSALQDLAGSDGRSSKALEAARARAQEIGILNGTVAAEGPGLVLTIRDPGDLVRVADIVDTIQELRGAGAETMQIDGVRVGVSTAVTGGPGDLAVDGHAVSAPYEFVVIGSPQGMETAMNIPGGVVPHITSRGGSVTIVQSVRVVVDALRPLDTPQYASPETDD